jgi:phospholipid/cholesterol/gamma-HCH transport system substrate-binding protein
VSQSLSRWQSVLLGLVVIAVLAAGGYGIARIAERQGLWADSVEVTAGFPEAHDIGPGTVVRIRGVDAGQVIAVEYPDHDDPGAEVTIRMKLSGKYASRIYADATAQIHGSGLLGAKVIAIQPGTPQRGVLSDGHLKGLKSFTTDDAVAEVRDTANEVRKLAAEAQGLVKDVRESNGTIMQLVKDDTLHQDVKALVAKADKAISSLEVQATGLGIFIGEGRETMRSVKQGTDAMARLPIVRNYVEDVPAILVRPGYKREVSNYQTRDLFEPGTVALHYDGAVHLNHLADGIKATANKNAEIVIVAYADPADKSQTAAAAMELTKKQAERVADHLKNCDVHKLGTFSRRKITALGLGTNPSPVIEKDPQPLPLVQVIVFTPQ